MARKFTAVALAAAFLLSALSAGIPTPALAQSGSDEWTTPVNLSSSGSAANPLLVVSADGQFHVVWQDAFAGTVYASGDGLQWSEPLPITPPFATYLPRLVADADGIIHAFWIDKEGKLLYSRVKSTDFGNGGAWARPLPLADSVAAVDAVLGLDENLHVSYVQVLDKPGAPAGVYYIRSGVRAQNWRPAINLAQSPYFRSLTQENARIDIAAGNANEAQGVYIAWDVPTRERVYVARSVDGGENWEEALEVDSPVDGTIAGGPAQIQVSAQGADVLLLWKSDTTGATCTQYYQWSHDGGGTWGGRQAMLQELPGCPQDNQVLYGQDGSVFLLTTIYKQMYLLAWNGQEWSSPQLQVTLASFVDPQTFKPVEFSCRQPALVNGNTLYVVGCDAGQGKDIWVTSRLLEETAGWFSQSQVWETSTSLTTTSIALRTPYLAADAANRIHAFWSQPGNSQAAGPGTGLYYARLEAGKWSSAAAVLASPEGKAEQPAVAVDPQDRLNVVWSGGHSGQIYFSQANASRAVIASAWSPPVALPSPQPVGSSPAILIDERGRYFVTYAIPLNEQRGIYLTRSEDGGQTWSDPVLVFDAEAAGWSMVDRPHLAMTGNGNLHLIWTRYSLPGGEGSLGLYYSRSSDSGNTWSTPQAVEEKQVVWSAIAGAGDQVVHRVWQDMSNGRTTLWHEQSQDSGTTWNRIAPVSIFGDTVGEPALASDRAGHLHLMQVVSRGINNISLQHWIWNGENWEAAPSMDLLKVGASAEVDWMVNALAPNGELGVIFASQVATQADALPQNKVFYASRTVEMPEIVAAVPAGIVTAPPPPTATPTPAVTPTSLAAGVVSPPDTGRGIQEPPEPGNAWLGSLVGPVLAGIIVLVVFVTGIRGAGLRRR